MRMMERINWGHELLNKALRAHEDVQEIDALIPRMTVRDHADMHCLLAAMVTVREAALERMADLIVNYGMTGSEEDKAAVEIASKMVARTVNLCFTVGNLHDEYVIEHGELPII